MCSNLPKGPQLINGRPRFEPGLSVRLIPTLFDPVQNNKFKQCTREAEVRESVEKGELSMKPTASLEVTGVSLDTSGNRRLLSVPTQDSPAPRVTRESGLPLRRAV